MTANGSDRLTFESIAGFQPGVIEHLIAQSYADLPADDERREKYQLQWRRADSETFENPDTIGRCTFITCLDGNPIGMGSFDPRGAPEQGVIGQNCILPAFRGQGFGRRQLAEILRRLKALGVRTAVVTTGEQDFFLPARMMYEACGFKKAGGSCLAKDGSNVIRYEKTLL